LFIMENLSQLYLSGLEGVHNNVFNIKLFAWLSCPIMPFVVSFLAHAFHHVLGCVNMELSFLFSFCVTCVTWVLWKVHKEKCTWKAYYFWSRGEDIMVQHNKWLCFHQGAQML
jgi:hypothetical protein